MVLIVGLPGADKTTMARRLEEERAGIRFTPDEWMEPLFGVGDDGGRRWVFGSQLLWGVAARALSLGVNVVLDYGCWSETERDLFRNRTHELGARAEIVVLNPPLEVLWERLVARNAAMPEGTFHISREAYNSKFQAPDAAELARWDHQVVVIDVPAG
ncbi:AAA family ATPase [Kribbella sp. NPDC023972]|uniref:AAA family ATPase n=1 Tax=Kribbella sp. NPDC023972 TaxID=3154795 RepID=UPI003410884E